MATLLRFQGAIRMTLKTKPRRRLVVCASCTDFSDQENFSEKVKVAGRVFDNKIGLHRVCRLVNLCRSRRVFISILIPLPSSRKVLS